MLNKVHKNGIYYLSVLIIICLQYSCGGTIGNIKKYEFGGISVDSLKAAVNRVNHKHPELTRYDTSRYKEGKAANGIDGDYFCAIDVNGTKYIFMYDYITYSPPNNKIEISLTSAATHGQGFHFAREIGFFRKLKFKSLFEDHFIKEIKQELKQ